MNASELNPPADTLSTESGPFAGQLTSIGSCKTGPEGTLQTELDDVEAKVEHSTVVSPQSKSSSLKASDWRYLIARLEQLARLQAAAGGARDRNEPCGKYPSLRRSNRLRALAPKPTSEPSDIPRPSSQN